MGFRRAMEEAGWRPEAAAGMVWNKGNVAALDKAKADLFLWKPKNA